MDAIVKAMLDARPCDDHRNITGASNRDAIYGASLACPACALSVYNAVLVAAREGGEWARAVPTRTLRNVERDVLYFGQYGEDILARAELRRREKEETR